MGEESLRHIFFIVLISLLAAPVAGAELHVSPAGSLSLDAGDTMSLQIGIMGATEGISGFHILLDGAGTDYVAIPDVSFQDWVMLDNYTIPGSDPGFIRGVDLTRQAEPGEGKFQFATISLAALSHGSATLILTPHIIEDDYGNLYDIESVTIPITVGTGTPASSGNGAGYWEPAATAVPTETPTPIVTYTPAKTATPIPAETYVPQEEREELLQPTLAETTERDIDYEPDVGIRGADAAPGETPVQQSPVASLLPCLAFLGVGMMIRYAHRVSAEA